MRGAASRPTIGVTAATGHVGYGAWSVLPGEGLIVTGRSEDGTVEALEDSSCPFVLGVLWHPEEYEKSQPIKPLVSEVS